MAVDQLEMQQQQMREEAANAERGRKQNVEVFTKMWLTLGPDVIKVAGSSHDAELAEAKGRAASRWSRLLDMKAQILRDEGALSLRPAKRPAQLSDAMIPDRTLAKMDAEYEAQTQGLREQLAALKREVESERKALGALQVDFKKGR
jgi:hypothetical protein